MLQMTADEALAHGLTNKLMQISSRRHWEQQERSKPPGGRLFHYTTILGLQGMVESNCLHASAAYFLNDSGELEYGRKILDHVLDQWEFENPEARDEVTAELVRDLRVNICREGGREALIQSVYLACFCQRDNVLSQWRYYGQAGGYSIGFPAVDGYIPDFAPEAPSYSMILRRVEYEEEKQIQKCREVLNLVLPLLDDPSVAAILRTTRTVSYYGPLVTYDFILKCVQEMLLDEILSFKDSAFHEEDEWRLIVRPRLFLLQGRDDHGKTPTRVYFRPSRGVLIPYLKLVPLKGKLPIVSIRSGPSVDRSRAVAATRLLLREHQFPDVEFSGSPIPVLI